MSQTQNTPESISRKVMRLLNGADFFRDQQGQPFITFHHDGRARTLPLHGKMDAVRKVVTGLYWQEFKQRIDPYDLDRAVESLVAEALAGPIKEVFCRVGRSEEGIVLDLCRHDGKVINIQPGGWETSDQATVRFHRPKGMLPLPLPDRQPGTLCEALGTVFGKHTPEDLRLSAAFLLGCLNPSIPLPALELIGPQGSAKTTRTKAMRLFIDPNFVQVRRWPQNERDLFVAANNTWILAFDNVSCIPDWSSDAICSIVTGGGYAARTLYTDQEETLFSVRRPVVLNAIHQVVVRPDLRDRAITITLPQILDHERIPEKEYWVRFREAHPRILAALLDCVSMALVLEDVITLERLPRMADWYRFVMAAAEDPASGFTPADFQEAFNHNRDTSREGVLDASPIARPLLRFTAQTGGTWHGTLTELLGYLNGQMPLDQRIGTDWPKSPQALRNLIDRIGPDLRTAGLSIMFTRSNDRSRERLVRLILRGGGAS